MCKRILITTIIICFIIHIPLFASAETTKPIKAGVVYGLSGGVAMVSKSYFAGYKMAVEEINKAGGILGRKVEFIVRDDTGNPELTTRYCRELITKEKVDFLFAGSATITMIAAQAVADQFKKLTFVWSHGDRATIEEWNPYTFRTAVTCTSEARMCAKLLKEEILKDIQNPTIYWISWDYEYGHSLHRVFMPRIRELMPNVRVVGSAWPRSGETDYGPFINHILAAKPDAIVNSVWAGGLVPLFKQCAQYGVFERSKIISMGLDGSTEYRPLIGMDMPEDHWSNTYDDEFCPNNDGQQKFYQKYRDFVGDKNAVIPSNTPLGYYIFYMVAEAIKKAGTTKTEALIKALEGRTIDTYWGPLKMRDFDHQLVVPNIWGPMIKKPGLPYFVMDATRAKCMPSIENDLLTKEQWLKIRASIGK